MKTVLIKEPTPAITFVEQADSRKYYGCLIRDQKGFITARHFEGPFFAAAAKSITIGNSWSQKDTSLANLLRHFILEGFEVFEFETHKELFVWLAE